MNRRSLFARLGAITAAVALAPTVETAEAALVDEATVEALAAGYVARMAFQSGYEIGKAEAAQAIHEARIEGYVGFYGASPVSPAHYSYPVYERAPGIEWRKWRGPYIESTGTTDLNGGA